MNCHGKSFHFSFRWITDPNNSTSVIPVHVFAVQFAENESTLSLLPVDANDNVHFIKCCKRESAGILLLISYCITHYKRGSFAVTQLEGQLVRLYFIYTPPFCTASHSHVSPEQYRHSSSCVTFTVMDYDWLSTNDFAGEAIVPLSDLCGLDKPSSHGGGTMVQPLILHLSRPKPSGKTQSNGGM